MTEKRACGNCGNAKFVLTPTGRIKKNELGKCVVASVEKEIAQLMIDQMPALSCSYIHVMVIWPDTDASSCHRWEPRKC